jgi:hypothetical protein
MTASRCKAALTTAASVRTGSGLHCADAFLDHTEFDRLALAEPAPAFTALAVTHRELSAGEMKVDDLEAEAAAVDEGHLFWIGGPAV